MFRGVREETDRTIPHRIEDSDVQVLHTAAVRIRHEHGLYQAGLHTRSNDHPVREYALRFLSTFTIILFVLVSNSLYIFESVA